MVLLSACARDVARNFTTTLRLPLSFLDNFCDVIVARPGDFAWAPRDVPHTFCVESETAKFLAFSTDGGMDRFFFATGEPAGALTLPPPPQGPPDVEALVAAMAEYGVEMVGPPPSPLTGG